MARSATWSTAANHMMIGVKNTNVQQEKVSIVSNNHKCLILIEGIYHYINFKTL